jgi:hypothetical protein
MSNSFSFMANHTWSHCISLLDNPGAFNSTAVENPDSLHMDYANCGFDHRHMFNASVVAESHFNLTGWKGYTVNHWEIAPLVRVASGSPINITTGLDNSLTAVNNDRPNIISKSVFTHAHPLQDSTQNPTTLNIAAFSANAIGSYGNLGRNAFMGPKFVNVDASLGRKFPIYDRLTMQLRLEAFNLLNHPNFSNPSTLSINSTSSFGKITSTASGSNPRLFQGALKLIF